jgi:autotransporter-associated beta strand protein
MVFEALKSGSTSKTIKRGSLLAVAVIAAGSSANAAGIKYWTGGTNGTSQSWATSGNWSATDGVNANTTSLASGDTVIIDSTDVANTTVGSTSGKLGFGGNYTLASISFGNNTAVGGGTMPATLQVLNSISTSSTTVYNEKINGDGVATDDELAINASYTGNVTINGNLNADTATVATTFQMATGAIDIVNSSSTMTIAPVITANGTITKTGAGTLTLTGANLFNAGFTTANGTVNFGANNTFGSLFTATAGTSAFVGNQTFTANASINGGAASFANGTYTGMVTLASGTVTTPGTGTESFAGGFTITGGTATMGGSVTYGTGTINFNGGTFNAVSTNGIGNSTTTLSFNGGTFNFTGVSNVAFASGRALSFGSGNGTFGVTGSANTIISLLGTSSGIGGLTKTGVGALALDGVSSYLGNTTVSAGALYINNSSASTNLTVAPGATIGGNGTLAGALTMANGSHLAPISISSANTSIVTPATTTVASLSMSGSAILDYRFGGSGYSSSTAVTGALTLPTTAGAVTLNLTDDANASGHGSLGLGTYTLFTYGSLTNAFDPAVFAVGTPKIAGDNYTFSQVGSAIDLTIAPNVTGPAVALSASTPSSAYGSSALGAIDNSSAAYPGGLVASFAATTKGYVTVANLVGTGPTFFVLDLGYSGTSTQADVIASLNGLDGFTASAYVPGSFGGLFDTAGFVAGDVVLSEGAPQATNGTFAFALDNLSGVTVDKVGYIPEPASLSLLGVASLGLLARKRRA